MMSQLIGIRPSDILEFEGSSLERFLLDVEILSQITTPSVHSQILAKRAKWKTPKVHKYIA